MAHREDPAEISPPPGVLGGPGALNPAALPVEQVARVLTALGARYATVDRLRSDIEAGAPANADGTVNLVSYAAWLAKELANRGA